MLRKIALSSMKGRKKDTIVLSLVIILSFLFIVVTTVFYASSKKTKYVQKAAMFGKWKLAYYNGDEDIKDRLLELKDVDKVGVTRIIGRSSTCGTVGTINEDFLDLGSFHMYEGRMPENKDEIALELNQLKQFRKDIKVGDTIEVRFDIPIYRGKEEDASKEQMERIRPELEKIAAKLGKEGAYGLLEVYSEYVTKIKRTRCFT